MELSKKDYDFCKGVYDELRSGVFSKTKVIEAYDIMFGNKGQIIANKKKRAQVFSYFSRDLVTLKSKSKSNASEPIKETSGSTSQVDGESNSSSNTGEETKKKTNKRRTKKSTE